MTTVWLLTLTISWATPSHRSLDGILSEIECIAVGERWIEIARTQTPKKIAITYSCQEHPDWSQRGKTGAT